MSTLILNHGQELQGNFILKKWNFLFVFQVNCPGCFMYGIPFVNKLYAEFGEHLSFLGLSTAFEDFEFNTEKNTKLLITTGEVVGETKKALASQGLNTFTETIDFPIAMDTKADASFDFEAAAQHLCRFSPRYIDATAKEQQLYFTHVRQYLINQPELALTFTLNQMRGTPTMLVFDENYNIQFHQFGHTDYSTIQKQLLKLLH